MLPGTADDVRLHGVAPQAKLMGYKVCADVGSCLTQSTIMAIEDAVSPVSTTLQPKPVAHVINMSLGGAGGPDDATSVASDNASLLGTIVVASAGNSGTRRIDRRLTRFGSSRHRGRGEHRSGGGSNSVDVTTGERTGMIANDLDGAAAVTSDITSQYVYCGLAETPADCPDSVSGKIALIARGSTYTLPALPTVGSLGTGLFSNKAASAIRKGCDRGGHLQQRRWRANGSDCPQVHDSRPWNVARPTANSSRPSSMRMASRPRRSGSTRQRSSLRRWRTSPHAVRSRD